MRRRVALYGATPEALQLLPLLEANPEVEIAVLVDPDPAAARARLAALDPEGAARLGARVTDDVGALLEGPGVDAVIDAGEPSIEERCPELASRGVQIVSPLTARLLFGYGVAARDRKQELLQALHEIVESVNLTVDTDELFSRMLEIAMGVTGADGGSLMLLDDSGRTLRVRVAIGVERELWPKIRVPLGEGVAGKVAAEGRAVKLRGKADRERYRIVRERFGVESALCVPLVRDGRVLGVLNLHHSTRADAFDDDDLGFAEELGRLDAEIIARAQEHEALRTQAGRYAIVREVRRLLTGPAPLEDRLQALCLRIAEDVGGGIATCYLRENGGEELRMTATSLRGGGFAGEYRIVPGQGVDGRAAATRRPAFLRGETGALDYAALPLLEGERLLGVLSVQAGTAAPALGRSDLEETLAEIAAVAADEIAQAAREARMSARATKVGAINEAGVRLLSAREPSEVIGQATSQAALILEADHAVLRVQDPETRRFVIRSYYGSADGRQQEQLFKLDKQVSVDAIKRRQPLRVEDTRADEKLEPLAAGVRSLLAAPLLRDQRVIGSLALYDKVSPDRFGAGAFTDEDLDIFARFANTLERALAQAELHASARAHRSHDEESGLASAEFLARRIDEEIARAGARTDGLALVTCRIENQSAIRAETDPVHADRVLRRVAEALRDALRDFDVPARSGDDELAALLPDPGDDPEGRIADLAREVADTISKDDALNAKLRIELVFGYALHPADGDNRERLLERARAPRIRML